MSDTTLVEVEQHLHSHIAPRDQATEYIVRCPKPNGLPYLSPGLPEFHEGYPGDTQPHHKAQTHHPSGAPESPAAQVRPHRYPIILTTHALTAAHPT